MADAVDGKSQTTQMRCPYCLRQATVRIVRYATRSPQHVDLECECERCGEKWQAADDVNV